MEHQNLLSDFTKYLREKKAEGKKVIAFMAHDNFPEELIDAAGFIPLRMIFAGNDELMNVSHDYLPPSTCSFAQSCIGLFSDKPRDFSFLEQVDYFVVSNHCVSDTCASEIISKYCFIPGINFYASYTNNNNALTYYEAELRDFKKQLEFITEKEIAEDDILASIKKYNNFKKILSEVDKVVQDGSKKLQLFQKALLFGPSVSSELEKIIKELKQGQNSQEKNNSVDLILTGCSIFIGDYLNVLIEGGGGNIRIYDTWIGNNYFSQLIDEESLKSLNDPMQILVERFKENIYGDHTVPNYFDNKVNQLIRYIEDHKKKTGKDLAVINHVIKFCDHVSLFQSILKEKLQNKGIKILNLERDYSRANKGQLTTRIEAFLEML